VEAGEAGLHGVDDYAVADGEGFDGRAEGSDCTCCFVA
jgi:hypothetical protein